MSRLLVLLPSVPAPLDAGARIRNHGLLMLLGQDHEVDTVAFGSAEGQADLASVSRRAVVVPLPDTRSAVRRGVDIVRTDLPDMALRLWSALFRTTVQRMLRGGDYDAVQAEGIEMAPYLSLVPAAKRVYDAHNAEFLLQQRLAMGGSTSARVYSEIQWRRLQRFEGGLVAGSRLTLAVSNHDANQLLALANGSDANVRVVPNGIDVAGYTFRAPGPDTRADLLFLGKLDFRPNAVAVRWLIDEVLAHLRDARLFAVGDCPPGWLVRAGQHDERIAVTGYVPDERPYLARCTALVLPIATGGGSRLKALIGMASGLPIVSTRLGMEGIEAEPDTHYLRADTPAQWISSLGRLQADAELRSRLARNARTLVESRYDWSAIHAQLRAAYAWLPTP
jgi:glycosyltransferase involved in cell wall biosynthesis